MRLLPDMLRQDSMGRGKKNEMANKRITNQQWTDIVRKLIEILKNEDREKAIEYLQQLIDNK